MVPSTACDAPRHVPWRSTVLPRWWGTARTMALVAFMVLCAGTATWSDAQLGRQLHAADDSIELIYLPSPRFLKAVSLGYTQALADVLWFRTINYFGKHYRADRVYTWLAYMCGVVTDLDPGAEHVYRFAGVILPWEADKVDDGIALLEKGTRNMPDSWRLHYMLGFSYYFFKNDLAAANGALQTAMRLPDAPAFVARLAASILAARQGPDTAVGFLSELENAAPNDEMRIAIRQRVRELALAQHIDEINAAVQTFRARFQRLPSTLGELASAGILTALPPDPFGGQYVYDPRTGGVRSSIGGAARHLGSSQTRAAFLSGKRRGE